MESKNKISELQWVSKDFSRMLQRYRASLCHHALNIQNESVDGIVEPTSMDSLDVWRLYVDVIKQKHDKEALESAWKRCEKAVEYLVKLVHRNSPNINSEEQFQEFVLPYEHCRYEMRVDLHYLRSQELEMHAFIRQAGEQIFDFSGGEFSSCYVEFEYQPQMNKRQRITFYFVK